MHEGVRFAERPYSPEEGEVLEEKLQKKRHIVTSILAPALFRLKEIHFEMTAELRIAQAGLALLQYKQNQGAFPDSLEELKLQNINDPFSDGLLKYKTEGQDFILYSFGPDQKDNNGSPRQKKQRTELFKKIKQIKTDWDIVWHFPDKQ